MKSLTKNTMRDEDPREALLKYAKDAETNPYWVMPGTTDGFIIRALVEHVFIRLHISLQRTNKVNRNRSSTQEHVRKINTK